MDNFLAFVLIRAFQYSFTAYSSSISLFCFLSRFLILVFTYPVNTSFTAWSFQCSFFGNIGFFYGCKLFLGCFSFELILEVGFILFIALRFCNALCSIHAVLCRTYRTFEIFEFMGLCGRCSSVPTPSPLYTGIWPRNQWSNPTSWVPQIK